MKTRIIILIWLIPVMGLAQNRTQRLLKHYLREHIDVSGAGAVEGDVLTYDATYRGWKPRTPVNLTGLSNDQIVYINGDTLSGSSNFTWDGTIFTAGAALNPRIRSYRNTGTGAAYMEVANTAQTWQFYVNGNNAGIEPDNANGTLSFRNLANTTLFTLSTSNGRFSSVSGASTFNVSGKGGTATSVAGYDTNDALSTVNIGSGLSLTSATLSADKYKDFLPLVYNGVDTIAIDTLNIGFAITGETNGLDVTNVTYTTNLNVTGNTTIRLLYYDVSANTYAAFGSGTITSSTNQIEVTSLTQTVAAGDWIYVEVTASGGEVNGLSVNLKFQ